MVSIMLNANASNFNPTIQFPTLSPNLLPQPPKSHPNRFPVPSTNLHPRRRTLKISCRRREIEKSPNDDERLALELNAEVEKLKSSMARREEALDKSRAILFAEVCDFAGLRSEDLRSKWMRMDEDERWVMARGFVAEWSEHYHPLSARCVKEMVDEYLGRGGECSDHVGKSGLFPDLGRLLGLFRDYEE